MSHTEKTRTSVIILAVWILIAGFAAAAFAEEHCNPRACPAPQAAEKFDRCTLPWPDTIEAQTDITAFMQSGVPAELQIAALRRAWSVDPAIRDYKGLQENDWDFSYEASNDIAGFGDVDPDHVQLMLARLFSEPTTLVAARTPVRPDYVYDSIYLLLANWLQRTVKGVAP